ncbi:MAG: glycosyltransferase [Parvularculaceae bacterium]
MNSWVGRSAHRIRRKARPPKGIDHLVAVASRIHKEFPGARFVIVGDGSQRAEGGLWIREAGLEGVVILAGRSDAPHVYLAAADIFFLPSRWESLPISIVEAFRAGLPVIATDTGGVNELVDDSVGYVCKVGDITELTARLGELIRTPLRRSACATAALERSREERFDTDAVNLKLGQAYLEMIGQSR